MHKTLAWSGKENRITKFMIKLSHLKPFAGGCKRNCYIHPEDANKVIKIIPPDKSPEVLHSQKIWIRRLFHSPRSLDANRTERKKFEQLQQKLGNLKEKIPHLVEYFGKAETDLGEGLVFEAIRNFDGEVAESISDASKTGGYDKAELLKALDCMSQSNNDATIYNDVGRNNIVVQILKSDYEGSPKYKFYVVDGIQCRALIPITEYSEPYARARKAKKIGRIKNFIIHNF